MKNLFSMFGVSLLLLASCSNEDFVTENMPDQLKTRAVAEVMKVENGVLSFPDYDSYYAVFSDLYSLSAEELAQWDERIGYKSLLTKEINKTNLVEVTEESEEESEDKVELDDVRKALYSDKGLLAIGDTLYKVQDEYIYRISKNSQITLSDVESDPEKYQDIRFKHTVCLRAVPSATMASTKDVAYQDAVRQGNDESRSHLVKVAKRRREHVKFEFKLSDDGRQIFLNMYMTGRAQKKKIGIWGNTFDDEMVWGTGIGYVVINNGVVRPNIFINRFENVKKVSNPAPYPLAPVGQLKSCLITAYYDFYKNDTAKDQHYKASFSLN